MTCREYRASVAAELDGERPVLSLEQREAHAARCPECATEGRRLLALRRALQAWPDAGAPPGLAERALARCVVTARPQVHRAGWWPAAAVVVAAFAAAMVWVRPASAPAPPPPAALSARDAYALGALSRAGAHVALAWERTRVSLDRVIELQELGRKRL